MPDNSRVLQWIESVTDSCPSHFEPKPSKKRHKRTHNTGLRADYSVPYNTSEPSGAQESKGPSHLRLRTPPETDSNMESTPIRQRKRPIVDTDKDELMEDRTPTQKSYSQRQRADGQRSPKKSKNNTETRSLLLRLETPVQIKLWDLRSVSEQEGFCDIKELFEAIATHSIERREIIPNEINLPYYTAIFKAIMGVQPSDKDFRTEPMPSAVVGSSPDVNAVGRAVVEFEMLQKLQYEALRTKNANGHEAHWVSAVYAPLLSHVFNQQVRTVNISTATMEGDSVPMLRQSEAVPGSSTSNRLEITSEFCMTVTGSSVSINSRNSALQGTKDPRNLAHIQTRSGVKIVDYAVVMDPPENSTLRQTIFRLLSKIDGSERRHVNQTAYQLVSDDIIAVSIEAKLDAIEPALQLALWTAAWHKRMRTLRQEVFATHIASISDEEKRYKLRADEKQKRLITVPVIAVVGHHWKVYFAFFNDQFITMHGPLELGSTASLFGIYTIVACLRAIQEWIRTTFWAAMEDWFMVPGTAQT
ncbi:hypothetical protein O1611_g3191 [Lasiodiplodia mahajangana]|uniref:Uncharacterized protein n=1 Tax=Lasiodiplodia mahajangana TaxID=1108764 RepID=A0ACC2JT44_9PEZI|nr:hypothetical protein O1611_g3191 [Lasiodiplodia mahajangana]